MAEPKHTRGREQFAWDKGEPFPGAENKSPDPGDRAAIRLLLNIRAALPLATSDLNPVVILGNAALYLMTGHSVVEREEKEEARRG